MIVQLIPDHAFVICSECGSSVYLSDPESLVRMEEDNAWLRCRNNCCGHVARYSTSEVVTSPHGRTADYTNQIFLEE